MVTPEVFAAVPICPTRVLDVFTVKFPPLQPVLTGVVTQMAPVCAPVGTVVEIEVSESTVSVA
jgi:hypothetical protein